MLDVNIIKKDFPIFNNQPGLTYLDSTATSLKPQTVINALVDYYENYSANIHRGIYSISEKATDEFEKTRSSVAKFINADPFEIVFTRNTTESINLVAYSLGRRIVNSKDEVLTTVMEHHSNFVPWQMLAYENGAIFKIIDITDNGFLDLGTENIKKNIEKIISKKTKILALAYVSNVTGVINPVEEIIRLAKKINPKIITIVDAAQAAPHMKINVRKLNCDFLAFSSHKMLGPTNVGVLYGKKEIFDNMFPFLMGGGMIKEVTLRKTVFTDVPQRFEAGTPAIAEVIAFRKAIEYLDRLGLDNVRQHEKEIIRYCLDSFTDNFKKEVVVYGPQDIEQKNGIISFNFRNYHPHDIAQILDEDNICIRAGHHCAMPLHERFGVSASARASFYLYNSKKDIDKLVEGLKKAKRVLK
ncbi:MAG: Cysteine desulfurase, SufS subfamily [Candidatus Roizmanbacteria bacterium GW2011_GWA2_36_23]|uniref:cysteine desulfurase n=1 Tax=Candidatus Roizmanbacteria bacterium GW2011_GWA2_36_23 TaxID=1618480 RepID=A0A0G0HD72_9BACT|nr:MAG: Cysteine desulfurase, SufS subfamily [Candidatus Roizmanbacteria bacterium GW2011_GWA2_36_23]